MKKGNIKDIDLLSKYPGILKFIQDHHLTLLKPGKYNLNDKIYVNIEEYDTKNFDDALYEGHRKYLDIHYMINGVESIYIKNEEDLHTVVEYDEDKDIEFKSGSFSPEENIPIFKDEFLIIYPGEFHAPCLPYKTHMCVKKAVFKIKDVK